MKKAIIISFISLWACSTLFAQKIPPLVMQEEKTNLILAEAFRNGNWETIEQLSSTLPYSFRLEAYRAHKVKRALPVVLNSFLGFGIGSFVQGDYAGGAVLLTGELLGVTSMLLSLAIPSQKNNLLIGGGIATAFMHAGGIYRPFVYAKNMNEPLYRLLGL